MIQQIEDVCKYTKNIIEKEPLVAALGSKAVSPTMLCCRCGCWHNGWHCPAMGKKCTKCNKFNHFVKACRTNKLIQAINRAEEPTEGIVEDHKECWNVNSGKESGPQIKCFHINQVESTTTYR